MWSSSAGTLLFLLPTWRTGFEVCCPGGDGNAHFSLKKEGKKSTGRPKNPRPMKVPKVLRKLTGNDLQLYLEKEQSSKYS